MKGQVAIETLFLVIVVIFSVAFVSALVIQTQDTTTAYTLLRGELLEQINIKNQEIIIEEISIEVADNPIFYVKTIPNTLNNSDFELEKIEQEINQKTNFSNVEIQIN